MESLYIENFEPISFVEMSNIKPMTNHERISIKQEHFPLNGLKINVK